MVLKLDSRDSVGSFRGVLLDPYKVCNSDSVQIERGPFGSICTLTKLESLFQV